MNTDYLFDGVQIGNDPWQWQGLHSNLLREGMAGANVQDVNLKTGELFSAQSWQTWLETIFAFDDRFNIFGMILWLLRLGFSIFAFVLTAHLMYLGYQILIGAKSTSDLKSHIVNVIIGLVIVLFAYAAVDGIMRVARDYLVTNRPVTEIRLQNF